MLIERFRGLTSVLQDHWDNKLKFSKLFLILCGSSIGMMETEVLGYLVYDLEDLEALMRR